MSKRLNKSKRSNKLKRSNRSNKQKNRSRRNKTQRRLHKNHTCGLNCKCKNCSHSQLGGNCEGNCVSFAQPQLGGEYFYKEIGPMPGPNVGNAWSPTNLPTKSGISGDSNYLSPYDLNADPTRQQMPSGANAGYLNPMSIIGGYKYNNKHKHKRHSLTSTTPSISNSKKGGGLVPQDLVNLGRDFSYNIKSAYNALNGYQRPVDPTPYEDQLTGNNNPFLYY